MNTTVSECSISTYQANTEFEDRHFVEPATAKKPTTLLGVFDGHGGWQASEYAMKTLPSVFDEIVARGQGRLSLSPEAVCLTTTRLSVTMLGLALGAVRELAQRVMLMIPVAFRVSLGKRAQYRFLERYATPDREHACDNVLGGRPSPGCSVTAGIPARICCNVSCRVVRHCSGGYGDPRSRRKWYAAVTTSSAGLGNNAIPVLLLVQRETVVRSLGGYRETIRRP